MKFVSRLTCANKQARVILVAVFSAGGLLGCSGLDNTIVDPVQWWAVNGWVGAVTIQLYDNNCHRFLKDIKFKRNEEVKVISCGDGQGQADVRFRREGYPSRTDPWSPNTSVSINQRTLVR
ncbi:MAG: hypothetical protein ACKVIB_00540 [Pseudomonadales bacterium]|jgi:hypothetical protein